MAHPLDPSRKIGTYFVDNQGVIQRYEDGLLSIETTRATELEALAPNDVIDFDLATYASVPLTVAEGHTFANWQDALSATFRVTMPDANPADFLAASPYQRVRSLDDRTVEVTVSQTPDKGGVASTRPTAADVQANRWIDKDHAELAAFAAAGAGELFEPTQLAKSLHAHVFRSLEQTSLGPVLATSTEVVRDPRGDCTEHAVLLAAVCRNQNLPARVAIGLIYDAESNAFAYHMWNEVWMKDVWVPVDATDDQFRAHVGRLKLADSNLNETSDVGLVAPVLNVLGRLSVELVAVN